VNSWVEKKMVDRKVDEFASPLSFNSLFPFFFLSLSLFFLSFFAVG
jgi:hypothetical protein